MKRIAAPMVGGMVTSTILTLIVIPVIYEMWRGWQMRHEQKQPGRATDGIASPLPSKGVADPELE